MEHHTTTCDKCNAPAAHDFGRGRTIPGLGTNVRFLCVTHARGLVASRKDRGAR